MKKCLLPNIIKHQLTQKDISVIISLRPFTANNTNFMPFFLCFCWPRRAAASWYKKTNVKEEVKPRTVDRHWQRYREKLKFSSTEAASMPLCTNLTLWTATWLLTSLMEKTRWRSIKKGAVSGVFTGYNKLPLSLVEHVTNELFFTFLSFWWHFLFKVKGALQYQCQAKSTMMIFDIS